MTQATPQLEEQRTRQKGYGRIVRGFRTTGDAAAFLAKWRRLTPEQLMQLYPAETSGRSSLEVAPIHLNVGVKIQQIGIQGVTDIVGGGLQTVQSAGETTLQPGLSFSRPGIVSTFTTLGVDIIIDIFRHGIDDTGVPNFENFIGYRKARAFEYHINNRYTP